MNKQEIIAKLSKNEELKKELIEDLSLQGIKKNKKSVLVALHRGLSACAFNYGAIILSIIALHDAILTKENIELTIFMSFMVCGLSILLSVMMADMIYGKSPGFNSLKQSLIFSGVKKDYTKFKYKKVISLTGLNLLKKYLSSDEMKILLADKDEKLAYNSFNLEVFQQEQEERLKIEQYKKKSDALVDNIYKNNG